MENNQNQQNKHPNKKRKRYKPSQNNKQQNPKSESKAPEDNSNINTKKPYNKWKKKRYKQNNNKPQQKKEPVVYELCPICQNEIRDNLVSVPEKESQKNAHFDCIMLSIKKENNLPESQELCYLGGGRFGVIERSKNKKKAAFTIKDKIQYHPRLKR